MIKTVSVELKAELIHVKRGQYYIAMISSLFVHTTIVDMQISSPSS